MTLRLALSRISVRDDQRRVAMREEYSLLMGIWTTDTEGANLMDFFFFSFLGCLVDFGGSDFLSLLSVEEID